MNRIAEIRKKHEQAKAEGEYPSDDIEYLLRIAEAAEKDEAIAAWNTRPRCDECKWSDAYPRDGLLQWCCKLDQAVKVDFYCAKFERKK